MNPLAARIYAFVLLPVIVSIGVFFLVREDELKKSVLHGSDEPMVEVAGRTFLVEIADDNGERHLGLGERDGMPDDHAMLFLFGVPDEYGFWMKGMRFSLDLAWILDGRIVHIERNVPADSKRTMYPGAPATEVLETNAGALDGAGVGSEILFYGIEPD